ncbi:hypothetical protein SVIOM74S_04744 [Streptomyces violarus]
MTWSTGLAGLTAGLLIAVVTAPVGVSGAVFLLPVQLSVLGVPSPAVTPTNLLYNVVAGPGALLRHHREGLLHSALTRRLVAGTLPGVVIGAVVRVFAVPGATAFRLLVAALLMPLGLWLIGVAHASGPPGRPRLRNPPPEPSPDCPWSSALSAGSTGSAADPSSAPSWSAGACPCARVAPAALASTFATSVAGAAAFALLSLTGSGDIAPDWHLGLACGLGGLVGATSVPVCDLVCPRPHFASCSASWPPSSVPSTPCSHCTDGRGRRRRRSPRRRPSGEL